MADLGNGERRYAVHCSVVIGEPLRELQRQASVTGRGKALARAFVQFVRRLKLDPFSVGEPAYRLPELRMRVRTTIVRPLVVDFAVCEDRPLVFIKGVKLLSAKSK